MLLFVTLIGKDHEQVKKYLLFVFIASLLTLLAVYVVKYRQTGIGQNDLNDIVTIPGPIIEPKEFSEDDKKSNETYDPVEESNNPYAEYRETFSGYYLYDIYETNKKSEADGDWFVEGSEKFAYHKQFDPLHDENLNFEWSIELSEMEGTDPLSDSLNQYHRELFEEQKTLMETHQKEMMEMEPDEIRDRWMSIRFSNNLSTRASFKWGNVFTVVDMENTQDRRCWPIIANFNSVSGKRYELEDLFCIENYREKLSEIVREEKNVPGGLSESFSFLMGDQGLLLMDASWPPIEPLPLIEWEILEDMMAPEIWKDIHTRRTASEIAYEEFLNGQREVFIEKENTDFLKYLLEDNYCSHLSMEDILKTLGENYDLEQYNNDHRIETIEYTFIDSYHIGKKELAVKFTFSCGVEHINIVFIIVYEDGILYLRHVFDSWNRFGADLYEHGLIKSWGSGGASTAYEGEDFLDKDGRAQTVYKAVLNWGQYEPELFEQIFGSSESSMTMILLKMEYSIWDKTYVCLQKPDKDELKEFLGIDLMQETFDEKWKEFCKRYEQKNGRLYTMEEIDEQIWRRRRELGILEQWVETTKPDWKAVNHPVYKQYVKEIDVVYVGKL